GAVAVKGLDGGAGYLLGVRQPAPPQLGDRDGLEAEGRAGADFELSVDLGGELPCGLPVGADAGPVPLAVFVVAEVPDAAAEVGLDLADAERDRLLGHVILRE